MKTGAAVPFPGGRHIGDICEKTSLLPSVPTISRGKDIDMALNLMYNAEPIIAQSTIGFVTFFDIMTRAHGRGRCLDLLIEPQMSLRRKRLVE
jgi:hypothetical protein